VGKALAWADADSVVPDVVLPLHITTIANVADLIEVEGFQCTYTAAKLLYPSWPVPLCRRRCGQGEPLLSLPAVRHFEPVQFLFHVMEGIVADLVVGAHG
jgi:hypothetical protein